MKQNAKEGPGVEYPSLPRGSTKQDRAGSGNQLNSTEQAALEGTLRASKRRVVSIDSTNANAHQVEVSDALRIYKDAGRVSGPSADRVGVTEAAPYAPYQQAHLKAMHPQQKFVGLPNVHSISIQHRSQSNADLALESFSQVALKPKVDKGAKVGSSVEAGGLRVS